MGIFRQFPYSNFHEMNMDELIKIVKQLIDDWAEYQTNMNAWKGSVDDEIESFRNWFDNLDVDDEVRTAVNTAIDTMVRDGTIGSIIAPYIPRSVQAWLDDNITTPSSVVIDSSLTVKGACADARAAGQIKKEVGGLFVDLPYTTAVGYVDNTNGQFVDNYANWTRTGYIEIDPSIDLYIYSNYPTPYNAIYDANHNFIRSFSINQGIATPLNVPINAKYIAMSAQDPALPTVYAFQYKARVYNALAMGYNNQVNNLVNKVKWYNGTITSAGAYNFTNTRLCTDFIDVKGNQRIYGNIAAGGVIISEYDENKTLLYTQSTYYIKPGFSRMLKKETKYIRISCFPFDDSNRVLYPYNIYEAYLYIGLEDLISFPIKVMSYNMGCYHYGTGFGIPANEYNEKLINYRKFLGENRPDILGIQEYDTRMDEANTIWSNDVLWNHFYKYEKTTGSETALKSNITMDYGEVGQLSTGRYYTCGWLSGVFIISVHLSVGSNANIRRTEATEIINMCRQYDKYIIFGDFNAEPGEEESLYAMFTNAGMNLANCGFFGKFFTWSSNRDDFSHYDDPSGVVWYIDNIITSGNIKITNAYSMPEVYKELSSDHIPMVAELEI